MNLDEATERLNSLVFAAEEFLEKKGYGVSAAVPLGDPSDYRLRWGKRNRQWLLLLERDGGETVELPNTSRRIRVEALRAFPRLVEALIEAASASVSDIVSVCDTVEAFIKH
jgi:hypothetical protein